MSEAAPAAQRGSPPPLILITDSSRFPDEQFDSALEASLAAGLPAILLREKQLTSAKLLARASKLRALTRQYGAALYVHSQADVAMAVDADGVHLSASDAETIPALRCWMGDNGPTISISCHNLEEICAAAHHGADFIFLSPVFPTRTHPGAPTLGVNRFRALASQSPLPVVALGGIETESCDALHGYSLAVITAILADDDPARATRRLLDAATGSQSSSL